MINSRLLSNGNPPIVMSFAGHDPCGGAGIQADIETLASLGCHCTPIITALTAQDSVNVKDFRSTDPSLLVEQARAVLEDMPVAAFKLGMIGSVPNAEAIHTILREYDSIPVILDPVLAAGGGGELATASLVDAIIHLILPLTTLITPNTPEARRLCSDSDSVDACAQQLMDSGCQYVLITGGHEPGNEIVNSLWTGREKVESYRWPRLEGEFHGTGCTLASACAAYIGHGASVEVAVRDAQQFTWQTVQQARRLGMGQAIPNRLFWAGLPSDKLN
ncbi:MAG: bifunctional hydroxymethylpyrimidine kinase/phosphomethylpyrimidine kinase [Ketobacteraceae bacterium]|nr:bifunctional hydroxymethylpyrimidine kinase/phosphomethylpyrimidine kinase [Ketobacteraceae bacterium]